MSHRRVERLNAQLKRELSGLIRSRLGDPRVASATVTHVRVTSDLSLARVFVRTLGSDDRDEALKGLDAASPYLRRLLGAELQMRRVPELRFEFDETLDDALRIEQLLQEVRPDQGWDEVTPEEEAGDDGPDTGTPDPS
jgi:ribosome-binding factor A